MNKYLRIEQTLNAAHDASPCLNCGKLYPGNNRPEYCSDNCESAAHIISRRTARRIANMDPAKRAPVYTARTREDARKHDAWIAWLAENGLIV